MTGVYFQPQRKGKTVNVQEWLRQRKEQTWFGQKVTREEYAAGVMPEHIPEFRREHFGEGDNRNEYLDRIVRLPIGNDTRTIPVATVSRRYALIQHKEVFLWLKNGLDTAKKYTTNLSSEIVMSEYGERMKLTVHLPELGFKPEDDFEVSLGVEVRNSVDRSCAFEVRLHWRRLVCSNGTWVRESDRLRKVHHVDWMNRRDVADFIKERVEDASGMKDMINRWIHAKLDRSQIEGWANDHMAKAWGVHAAARICHIARSGYDGIVGRPKAGTKASQYPVSSDVEVPGACAPIRTVYHLAQALSWVAQHRPTIEDSDAQLDDIPRLLKPLLSAAGYPTLLDEGRGTA
jgi:hypothetical protein